MPDRHITDPQIEAYARSHSSPEPPTLVEVARRTREASRSHGMLTGHLEGRFLNMLAAISGARQILEIGTFTGYSALAMAEALPDDGRVITLELDERHAGLAREHFALSANGHKIELMLGPALETLATLEGPFDMVFIDADKPSYAAYFEAVLPLLSERGFICVDNVLWSGEVLEDGNNEPWTVALREFNALIAADARVESVMIPIRDGLSIIRPV